MRAFGVPGAGETLDQGQRQTQSSSRPDPKTACSSPPTLVIAAIVVAKRTHISFRIATRRLVMCAATTALGTAFVWYGLTDGVSAASLFTLTRPLLGIVHPRPPSLRSPRVMARPSRLDRPHGPGEVALTVGSLIYTRPFKMPLSTIAAPASPGQPAPLVAGRDARSCVSFEAWHYLLLITRSLCQEITKTPQRHNGKTHTHGY